MINCLYRTRMIVRSIISAILVNYPSVLALMDFTGTTIDATGRKIVNVKRDKDNVRYTRKLILTPITIKLRITTSYNRSTYKHRFTFEFLTVI